MFILQNIPSRSPAESNASLRIFYVLSPILDALLMIPCASFQCGWEPLRGGASLDIVYVLLALVLFASAWLLIALFERV